MGRLFFLRLPGTFFFFGLLQQQAALAGVDEKESVTGAKFGGDAAKFYR